MIWNILAKRGSTVELPREFNATTMYQFIQLVLDEQQDARCSRFNFDFKNLKFVEPVGIVVLSNLIEYLKKAKVSVAFINHTHKSRPTSFLDDAGFFEHYLKKRVFEGSALRSTTVPLKIIGKQEFTNYLYFKLMPWIGSEVGLSKHSLDSLRTSLEEIFHNVNDHSGVGIGCTFAQHFPNRRVIQVAISDFGYGIPNVVRTKLPDLSDQDALRMACEEGFTTQSNVRNRGAGLPNLMRYVTQRNGGNVLIASGKSNISAAKTPTSTRLTARQVDGFYPGTLVRVVLQTNTFEDIASDVELEPFEW